MDCLFLSCRDNYLLSKVISLSVPQDAFCLFSGAWCSALLSAEPAYPGHSQQLNLTVLSQSFIFCATFALLSTAMC